MEEKIEDIELLATDEIQKQGYPYQVKAEVVNCFFDTRVYEEFTLPAGNYDALRLTIGRGEGENWWCVAFPPLCMGAATETIEEATTAGHFTEKQSALMTEDSDQYVLKFKALEWLGALQHAFK